MTTPEAKAASGSVVRHIVGGVGMVLVGFGLADTESVAEAAQQIEAILGAVAFFSALGAGIYEKVKRRNQQ